jgi:hypothetical protein
MASSLELYELSVAINRMLADPLRILEVRQHLHPGAQVMYYDERRGTLAPGRIVQLQPSYAIVQDDIARTQWKLSYAAIVADPSPHAEQTPQAPPRHADMAAFKPGDTVSFTDKHLREHIGTITRMNAKTCSILCDGEQWRVSPALLSKIIDL